MKKILLSLVAVCATFSMNAQVDTLTEWFTGSPSFYAAGPGNGYVFGSNVYGEKGMFQRFDNSNGLTGTGTVTGALLWTAFKSDAGGSFDVVVYDFAGGTGGSVLATTTVTLASVDTTAAGLMVAEGTVGYNVAVTFSPAINVTSSSDLAIGILVPTTIAAGDSIAFVSNTPGDYAAAATHSWSLQSDDSWIDMNTNWSGFLAGMAIYPTVDLVAGITEASIEAKVYPNPTSTILNVQTSGVATTVSILSMDGKVISTTDMNGTTASVNVADLNAGVYFYEVVAADGSVVRNTFVKK